MNKLIESELKKVTSVKIDFSDKDEEIFIPKQTKINLTSMKVGTIYKLELDDSLLTPSSNSTFASNWNQGRVPAHKIYIAEVVQVMGEYIKVDGVAEEDPADRFFGWLPFNSLQVLEKDL